MKILVGVSISILAILVLCTVSALALAHEVSEVTLGATVLNAAPSVTVKLTPDDAPAPGVQVINPEPATTNKTVTIIANVRDLNGYDDLTGVVTATITGPSVVADSPVSLSFNSVVNVTTVTYTGSSNMSNHSEGDYKVEVTATDFGGLTGVGSATFTYSYGICELPDLVVTDVWTAEVGKKTRIYYNITNVGTERVLPSYTDLTVDGVFVERDRVRSLQPDQSSTERFNTYEWICTASNDTIQVCADYENSITECIETNNCRIEIWSCANSSSSQSNSPQVQVQESSSTGNSNSNFVINFLKAIVRVFSR